MLELQSHDHDEYDQIKLDVQRNEWINNLSFGLWQDSDSKISAGSDDLSNE